VLVYAHGKPYVPYNTMVERMVGSTSSYSNIHGVVDDNSHPYRNIVMDAMRMNQGHVSQCLIIDEEPNVDATRFFDHLKDYDKPLWDGCKYHNKLLVVAHVFTIKSNHGLSEVDYDIIAEWTRSILPKGNNLKENFYAAKSIMKPFGLGYQKINKCTNFCMLYYLENIELTECSNVGILIINVNTKEKGRKRQKRLHRRCRFLNRQRHNFCCRFLNRQRHCKTQQKLVLDRPILG
jgi:hypothetical protein